MSEPPILYSGKQLRRLRDGGWNLAITLSPEGLALDNLVVVLRHDQLDLLADRIIEKLEARAQAKSP